MVCVCGDKRQASEPCIKVKEHLDNGRITHKLCNLLANILSSKITFYDYRGLLHSESIEFNFLLLPNQIMQWSLTLSRFTGELLIKDRSWLKYKKQYFPFLGKWSYHSLLIESKDFNYPVCAPIPDRYLCIWSDWSASLLWVQSQMNSNHITSDSHVFD